MKKTDTERLKKIVSLWDALSSEIEQRGISREMLLSEQFSQWAVTTPVYNIGEQVYQLSPEFKKEHPDIPWSVVSGLRHRLVHDYLTTYITYEENVLPITGGDFALTFLDGTQSGYDVHYATAAALMFRYYGIPARYVEGYLVTKDDAAHMKSGQTLDVGGNRAHAWVEYYQDGLGWLPFEATPTYFSAMEKAEQYQNISGLVGQAPLDYTADNLDDAELENPAAEALREFWLKHRLTILLTLAVLLAAGMVGLLIGWLIFERRRTKKRKEGFFGADAAASIDAIFRYMMDVLRARGMAAKNCPPADYVSYMDEDLREEYLAAAKLWQEARFRGKPMQELQRRRVLRLKDEIWERTWHSASLKERLRLKYVEFL